MAFRGREPAVAVHLGRFSRQQKRRRVELRDETFQSCLALPGLRSFGIAFTSGEIVA
jgi:hypothetical protein